MALLNFGTRCIPITFYLYGKHRRGTLTEVQGTRYAWFLHGEALVDVLIWDGALRWKGGTKELVEQLDYFEAVLI